ncbi:MAG: NAD(P)/FAD-dependent oxidoreductase [Crenarchaeota archaeon]|nr:NAD(P)/FAD-dependent oxidoreductase [Thermoproteota archaeon]
MKPIVVIGGGVGGYTTAVRIARANSHRVVLIERRRLGGECANYGCVPTKTMYVYSHAINKARKIGVAPPKLSDIGSRILAEARRAVEMVVKGIESLVQDAGVELVEGEARVKNSRVVVYRNGSKVAEYEYSKLIVATGTEPRTVPPLEIDERLIMSNRGFFQQDELPSSIAIVGAGAIGTEIASILASLGAEVHLIELMDRILPTMDRDVSRVLAWHLRRLGVKIHTSTTVTKVSRGSDGVELTLSSGERISVERVLVAIGRVPNTKDLGLETAKVELDEKGFVRVSEVCQTSNSHVYAVGDVNGPPFLAHKALLEGRIVATLATHRHCEKSVDRSVIPTALFTEPEVCSVGLTEEQAKSEYGAVDVVRVPIGAWSRAIVEGETRVLFKVIVGDGKIVGMHIVGPGATEVCACATALIYGSLDPEEGSWTPVPHLTYSEVIREVLEDFLGEPLHMI